VKLRSLHARLVAGALIWAVGLLAASFLFGFAVVMHSPRSALLVHNSMIIVGGVIVVTAGLSVIRRGLSPFRMLQDRLADVRDGRTSRLEGDYPTEVEPLVNDLNTLLEERERRVAKAVAKAGDLAHGLKTPLAVLAQDVDRAAAAGNRELAASIGRQVERMRRQITSHLAQTRATAGAGVVDARSSAADTVQGLVRTMERLYAERKLSISSSVAPDLFVRVPVEDLEEMLGNLLDNACKWARSRVAISAAVEGTRIAIDVDDDGAGLEPAMREDVLQRGVRADEATPGSGLGLAIVRDLAAAYGGVVTLQESATGGVRARLELPAAQHANATSHENTKNRNSDE
jgi:signal transduction histidine kinase